MPLDEEALRRFQERLDEHTKWPSRYLFKFIVPQAKRTELLAVFDGKTYSLRDSKNGKYVGLTAEIEMPSGDAVADVYRRVSGIEGIVGL
jgi:putative lipoic acid-binding regulatory protein